MERIPQKEVHPNHIKALLVTADPSFAQSLEPALEELGINLLTGQEEILPDVVVYDGEFKGHFTAQDLAEKWPEVPVIFASNSETERTNLKDLIKHSPGKILPQERNPEILAVIIRTTLSERKKTERPTFKIENIEIDLSTGAAQKEGNPVDLDESELIILKALAANRGRYFSSQDLKNLLGNNPRLYPVRITRSINRKLGSQVIERRVEAGGYRIPNPQQAFDITGYSTIGHAIEHFREKLENFRNKRFMAKRAAELEKRGGSQTQEETEAIVRRVEQALEVLVDYDPRLQYFGSDAQRKVIEALG